ncbi:MAG: hypothetical protein ACR2MZ_03475 [Candidatus Dormibacter sp.]|uniref:hypothetical protein n=1 Tax=Candidatus Dormibacter sp. TaxID=2973982 RepID=UPI000DB05F91|nr:MAG: hypothetical protein DLM66_04870 [Candidatus Dormibacteraeota bacterium]
MTFSRASSEIRRLLEARDERNALRVVFQLVDDMRRALGDGREGFLELGPMPTGDRRFDALLAGLAEHEAREAGQSPPKWATRLSVVLDPPWYVSPYLRAMAEVESPEPLRARGILITAADLTRV